jgi:hypothetical protein
MLAQGFILVAFIVSVAYSQAHPIKLALTASSNVPSAEIVKDMAKRCPNVSLTPDLPKADFTMAASKATDIINGTDYGRYKFTLFDHQGSAIFSTSTQRLGNAVKDVCNNLKKRP